MIIDQISNISRYRGLSSHLDTLIDWLGTHDYKALETGRHDIDGDNVFANVMVATTRPLSEAHYEVHARYMDVQVDVEGREAFKVSQGETREVQAFNEADDFGLCDADSGIDGDLDDNRFVIYLVDEPHMPNLQFPGDGERQIKKICFKVLAE